MEIREIALKDMNPAPYNPRKNLQPGDREYEDIKVSIVKFGYIDPLVWNKKTKNLVGGHQRYKILLDMGYKKAQVSVVNLSLADEKLLNIALNKLGGDWDYLKLGNMLEEFKAADIDFAVTGFSPSDLDGILGKEYDAAEDKELEQDNDPFSLQGLTPEYEEVMLVNEEVVFPSKNFYGIPELKKDVLGTRCNFDRAYRLEVDRENIDKAMLVWGHRPPKEQSLLEKTIVCFYTWDDKFEFVYQHPSAVAKKLMSLGMKEIIQTDFSTWLEDPRAVQIWAVYKNFWIARLWQEMGLKVIPNITYSDIESLNYTLVALPKELEVASIQLRTSHSDQGAQHDQACLFEIFKQIKVNKLICYAESSALEYHEKPLKQVKSLIRVEPFMARMDKGANVLSHGNIRNDMTSEAKKRAKQKKLEKAGTKIIKDAKKRSK